MNQNITIHNFKSFSRGTSLRLGNFCVFVGPNAAGKSNFVDAFRFLRDCLAEGIGPAVTARYGWSNLRCRRRRSTALSFSITGTLTDDLTISLGEDEKRTLCQPRFTYRLTLEHHNDEFEVTAEAAQLIAHFADQDETAQEQMVSHFTRTLENVEVAECVIPDKERSESLRIAPANRNKLFLANTFSSLAALVISGEILGWRFYDPDPRQARLPSLPQRVDAVSATGDTLALVLHQLRRRNGDDGERRRILDVLQILAPGFEDWETEQLADGRIAFKVRERGLRSALPALAVSDGTVRLLTILAALLWAETPASAVFIEEPERSLHPAVMPALVELMRNAADQTQVITTTHSADFVRQCRPEEVYLMDKVNGCTVVTPAASIGQIEEFLKRFTLDQLWLQGHLERGIP